MINLPLSPNVTQLRSFWLVISLICGFSIGLLSSLLVSPGLFALSLVVTLGLALPGWFRPRMIASFPYRAWNKLARLFAFYASQYLMLLYFSIVFTIVGRAGSSLTLQYPSAIGSGWAHRGSQPTYNDTHGVTVITELDQNWVVDFLGWATRMRHWWAYCLLPFFFLLLALKTEREEDDKQIGIYTLF